MFPTGRGGNGFVQEVLHTRTAALGLVIHGDASGFLAEILEPSEIDRCGETGTRPRQAVIIGLQPEGGRPEYFRRLVGALDKAGRACSILAFDLGNFLQPKSTLMRRFQD